jgi:shikimate kinase
MSYADIHKKERIFLTGFMGSGKTTIGPILANTIGYEFADIDTRIERLRGKTINEIFREEGEERFRVLERNLLAELCRERSIVIALGGGTIADPGSRALIARSGILVYLKIPPDQLFNRLRNKTNRPMLEGVTGDRLDEEGLRTRLRELLRKREPYYNSADIVVTTGNQPVGLSVDEIVKKLIPFIG